jgi:hypothetical protein
MALNVIFINCGFVEEALVSSTLTSNSEIYFLLLRVSHFHHQYFFF